jgi:RNA polymerase sigma-70 factor (ECF subfamily)
MERRDGRALAQLYDRYGRLVYALILRTVLDQAVAEDLAHETFLSVWNRARASGAGQAALEPWLLVAARNRAIDYARSLKGFDRRVTTSGESEDPRLYAPLEAGTLFADQTRQVKLALAQLPKAHQQAIDFAYFDGLSLAEISARLGEPLGKVKTWVLSALAALRGAMEAGVAR